MTTLQTRLRTWFATTRLGRALAILTAKPKPPRLVVTRKRPRQKRRPT